MGVLGGGYKESHVLRLEAKSGNRAWDTGYRDDVGSSHLGFYDKGLMSV
jgi:hypothetical protein